MLQLIKINFSKNATAGSSKSIYQEIDNYILTLTKQKDFILNKNKSNNTCLAFNSINIYEGIETAELTFDHLRCMGKCLNASALVVLHDLVNWSPSP